MSDRSWIRASEPDFEDDDHVVVRIHAVKLDDERWSVGASFGSPIAGERPLSWSECIAIMREAIDELTRMVDSAEARPKRPNDP